MDKPLKLEYELTSEDLWAYRRDYVWKTQRARKELILSRWLGFLLLPVFVLFSPAARNLSGPEFWYVVSFLAGIFTLWAVFAPRIIQWASYREFRRKANHPEYSDQTGNHIVTLDGKEICGQREGRTLKADWEELQGWTESSTHVFLHTTSLPPFIFPISQFDPSDTAALRRMARNCLGRCRSGKPSNETYEIK